MHPTNRLKFSSLLISLTLISSASTSWANSFHIFDGTAYQNKPDLSQFGVDRIINIDSGQLWDKDGDRRQLPDAEKLASIANRLENQKTPLVVLDIESWPLTGDEKTVKSSVAKYIEVLRQFREKNKLTKVSFYGAVPTRNYGVSIAGPTSPQYKQWQSQNDLLKPLAEAMDFLTPSVYTFYKESPSTPISNWVAYAKAQISEARRLDPSKPVYVFLWPQFHDSAAKDIATKYIPENYWKAELETTKANADGAIIWGGWDFKEHKPQVWDDGMPWWKITRAMQSP